MINFNIYMANIPKHECAIDIMNKNKTDTYVFIAPELNE